MLRPGGVARPASAKAFTTELSRVGSPLPVSVMTGWFIVIYHRRTSTGWTGSLMGCEQRRKYGPGFRGQRMEPNLPTTQEAHPGGLPALPGPYSPPRRKPAGRKPKPGIDAPLTVQVLVRVA